MLLFIHVQLYTHVVSIYIILAHDKYHHLIIYLVFFFYLPTRVCIIIICTCVVTY